MTGTRILAHDLGTSGDKATVYDGEGNLLASEFEAYETFHPGPNRVEQDATAWWDAVKSTTARLLESLGEGGGAVDAVSFSGQMMCCLPVDSAGDPLRRAIIWADGRASDEAAGVREAVGAERAYRVTGHRASPNYTAAKALWLREHEPEVFEATHKFLQAKDYVVQRLTGAFVTDYSDASGTNLLDLEAREWSAEILSALDFPREKLPELHASTDVVGEVTESAAEATGLAAGTPVVAGGGDGVCATVGAGVVRPGEAYASIGTSAWVATASDEPFYDPERRTFTWVGLDGSRYVPMGTMQSAGGSLEWALDTVGANLARAAEVAGVDEHELASREAAASEPGANGLLFLPYLIGERSPHWNPNARGAFIGLSNGHTQADLLRAVVEGVCLNLRVVRDALAAQGMDATELRAIGGGAQSDVWRGVLSDVFGQPVVLSESPREATSLGAAVAGGVGIGAFDGFGVVDEFAAPATRTEPSDEYDYDELFELFEASYERLEPVFERLAAMQ